MTLASRWFLAAICLWMAAPVYLSAQGVAADVAVAATAEHRPLAIEDLRQALAVSRLAANNQLPGLSLRAARAALSGGPPIVPLQFTPGQLSTSGNSNQQNQTFQQYVNEVQSSLTELSDLWSRHSVSPADVYDTFAAIVMPAGRPEELFLYARADDSNRDNSPASIRARTVGNVAALLVEWAEKAERIDDLQLRIRQRAEFPRAKVEANLLLINLALQKNQPESVVEDFRDLKQTILSAGSRSQTEAVGQVALRGLAYPMLREAAADVLQAAALKLTPTGNGNESMEPLQTWLKTAALTRLQLGQTEQARQSYQMLLTASDTFYSRYDGPYAAQQRRQLVQQIAMELLEKNQLIEAFHWVGELGDTSDLNNRINQSPVAAQLARQLLALPAQERFDFLMKWTFPPAVGVGARTLVGFVPTEIPPAEFVAALPEKLRRHKFEVLQTTPDPAVFHSGIALLDAAKECGKLDDVLGKLKELAASNAPGSAAQLLLLHELHSGSPDLLPQLEVRAAAVETGNQNDPKSTDVSLDDFVIALFALQQPELRDVSERILNACMETSKRLQRALPRVHIWKAYAEALRRKYEAPNAGTAQPVALRDWKTVGFESASSHKNGSSENWWYAVDDMLRSILSEGESALMFRYPLTGDFTIEAAVTEGGWSEGGLIYGGATFANYRYNNYTQLMSPGRSGQRRMVGELMRDNAVPNDCALAVQSGQTKYHVNGYVAFQESVGTASPWLGLRTTMAWTPVYQSLRITGSPQIPREVRLLEDARLLGWSASFFGERMANAIEATPGANPAITANPFDWTFENGELRGSQRPVTPQSSGVGIADSLVSYQRPMWNGEQIAWQFYYEPGRAAVHPVLDRVAFLLKPDGVQLHWLTEGDSSWLGLPVDNAVDDPDGQLHAGRLALKEKDWNDVVLALNNDVLTLSLNGQDIYRRDVSPDAVNRFGFYHHREREEARVRHVILSGEWPETLPEDLLQPAMPPTPAQRAVARELITEEKFADDALRLVRTWSERPPAERFEPLLNWVLPDSGEMLVRSHADFAAADDPLLAGKLTPVVSPALLLVKTARELNRLEELQNRLEALDLAAGSYSDRARWALLSCVLLARERPADANAALQQLITLLPSATSKIEWERWPEVVAANEALLHAETRLTGVRLLNHLVVNQIQRGQSSGWRFDGRIRGLRGLALAVAKASPDVRLAGGPGSHWQPVAHEKADTQAVGLLQPLWIKTPAGCAKLIPHENEFLYYQIPLLGDFTMECELSSAGYREAMLMYSGRRMTLNYQKKAVNYAEFLTSRPALNLAEEVRTPMGWVAYRLIVRGNQMIVEINGQKIFDAPLPENRDPWLAFYSHVSTLGEVRHVKITGNPVIPDELNLTAGEKLQGWVANYYRDDAAEGENPEWSQSGEEILGRKRAELAGTGREALLQYHRPLLEDGVLSYRFRYVPGELHVHPTLGRTTFLLTPEGVHLHKLTGGPWERTGLSPLNAEPVPGSGPLPLKAGEENTLTLSLTGNEITLELNGQPVHSGSLEPGNSRMFGLFHYPGETGVQVRQVSYRGDWPKQLPALADQELAAVDPELLNEESPRYQQTLVHDFAKDGLGTVFYIMGSPPKDRVQASPEGVTVRTDGNETYLDTTIRMKPSVQGDFDIQATFDDVRVDDFPTGSVTLPLQFWVQSPVLEATRIGLLFRPNGESSLAMLYSFDPLVGTRSYPNHDMLTGVKSGTFRAVRRGGQLHYFFRTSDDDEWRWLETSWLGREDQPITAVSLQTIVQNTPKASASIRWKSISVRAAAIDMK